MGAQLDCNLSIRFLYSPQYIDWAKKNIEEFFVILNLEKKESPNDSVYCDILSSGSNFTLAQDQVGLSIELISFLNTILRI